MSFIHHLLRSHRHHHHHHGHHQQDGEDAASAVEHLAQRVAGRLDLNEDQIARLGALIDSLQQQRETLRGDGLLQAASGLFSGTSFDRDGAQALLASRIATLQSSLPTLLDAVASFYDALDAEQQQVLRFMIRLGRRARDRHDCHDRHGSGQRGRGFGTQ